MIIRNYAGEDGKSHFEEIHLSFEAYAGVRERPHCKVPQAFDSSGGQPAFFWMGTTRLDVSM
jgi:hypothetical protein